MFKSSITKFLIASLGILMIGLFVAALILAVQAWTHYALAGRIARLNSTDKTLFDALVTVRAQVPKNSTALIADDDPRPVIGATYELASRTVTTALDALESTDIPNHLQLAAAIRDAWEKVKALQSTVDVQASRARAERNLHTIDDWREAIHSMLDTISTASVAVVNVVRIGDPLIAEMVQIRQTAWTIRDRYGLQCSMLRPNVDSSEPLNAAQLDSWLGNRAVYTFAWHTLDDFLLRPGVSTAVRERVDFARRNTQEAQIQVDAIVNRFDRSGKPAVGSAQWTSLCDGPFDSILAIAQQAQEEANQHAEAIRASAFRILLIAGIDLTSVIAFGAFAVVHVQRRLARPMKILTAAIARLSRRDFDEAVPSTDSPDELGSMAQALETLRASALEAERLQQAMNRFTADASHQMRTPLTVLRTHISVLGGQIAPNHEAYSSFKDIQEAADRLQCLLIQLLKLARADSAQALAQESETIDLRHVLQEIAANHVPQALEAGIELHFEAQQRPFPTRSNPIMIHEIFANLIDNAIRYNEAGGSVVIRLYDDGATHVVDVEDDGPGIPAAERDKVFTRFYRLNRDQSRVGSGLGLAIVKSLLATLNAGISVSAGLNGRGLRVRIAGV
ncbi:MAG TPA: HAMP domain-containing sensor histidine kinase [Steroidobacteraceae bacterium]|jgi:signal transduction histidine kinase|nr:HAMP domain-containing sensor histidine kinase [Steroidobacteraceae bacterium]